MNEYMSEALKEAEKCFKTDDVPVGAVIVCNDKIIARGHNTREKKHQITGHAEINAIRKACKKKKTWHLNDCEIYITLEPCPMCLEVIKQCHIKKIYYAAKQEKIINYQVPEMERLENVEKASKLIKNFFKNKRK